MRCRQTLNFVSHSVKIWKYCNSKETRPQIQCGRFGVKMKLVLASASPRRREILAGIIEKFEVVVKDGTEQTDWSAPPEQIVKELARAKAERVYKDRSNDLVLGADTIVYFEGKVLGKPKSVKDAEDTLRMLSGKEHAVYTGYCILGKDIKIEGACKTKVFFNELTESFIKEYVAGGSPMDKAGSYGIQDDKRLVKRFEGSYTNIVGLPQEEIAAQFRKIGILQ